jgi:hypothetical protein
MGVPITGRWRACNAYIKISLCKGLRSGQDYFLPQSPNTGIPELHRTVLPGRKNGGYAGKRWGYSSSPKRFSTSATRASRAACACLPVAWIVMVEPVAAASIIRPMIEVPPTVS